MLPHTATLLTKHDDDVVAIAAAAAVDDDDVDGNNVIDCSRSALRLRLPNRVTIVCTIPQANPPLTLPPIPLYS